MKIIIRHENNYVLYFINGKKYFRFNCPTVPGETLKNTLVKYSSLDSVSISYQFTKSKVLAYFTSTHFRYLAKKDEKRKKTCKFSITIDLLSSPKFVFSGGTFYFKNKPFYPKILIPTLCKTRIYPQERTYSCLYLKLPIFGFQYNDLSIGINIKKLTPFNFFYVDKKKIILAIKQPKIYERDDANFKNWSPGKWDKVFNLEQTTKKNYIEGNIYFHGSNNAYDLSKIVLEDHISVLHNKGKLKVDFSQKVLSRLLQSFDPLRGFFIESKLSTAEDYLSNNYFSLPQFSLILSTLTQINSPLLKATINKHLKALLSCQDSQGVFRNTVGIFGKYTHLGTGFGGYPGGQGIILQNLCRYYLQSNNEIVKQPIVTLVKYLLSSINREGLYPHTLYHFAEQSTYKKVPKSAFSLGGSADVARGLILANTIFQDGKLLAKATRIVNNINKYKWTWGYHRDYSWRELDGASAVPIILANVALWEKTQNDRFKNKAIFWGTYLLTWHKFWDKHLNFNGMVDAISWSFSPRVSPSDTLLSVICYKKLYDITHDNFWNKLATYSFSMVNKFLHKTGGLTEGLYLDKNLDLIEVPFESAFAADFYLRAYMTLFPNKPIPIDKVQYNYVPLLKLYFFNTVSLLKSFIKKLVI